MDVTHPDKTLVPEGTRAVVFGGPSVGQPQFLPLPALVTPGGWVVSQWQPTPGDLALLNAGAPLTLALRTGGGWPPSVLAAGGLDMRHYEDPHDHDLHRLADDGGPCHD
jgi:hypothetical protein